MNVKKNVLIIGAGGVAHVAAHKAAMNNTVLGDLCIASRTLAKCDEIIESIKRKGHIQNPAHRLYCLCGFHQSLGPVGRQIRAAFLAAHHHLWHHILQQPEH